MLLTDLRELKIFLEIDPDNTEEDVKLAFMIEYASSLIEEIINRPNMSAQSRTEYYTGQGTQKLVLKSRPVYTTPTIQVFLDTNGFFGSTSGAFGSTRELTYGEDFALQIDQPDGTSRSAILYRIRDVWPMQAARQVGYLSTFALPTYGAIKVIYTAGYTVDNLPPVFRLAVNLLIANMRNIFPLGAGITSESYEGRSLAFANENRAYLLSLVRPILLPYKSWRF